MINIDRQTHVLTILHHLVHTVVCLMPLVVMFPHTSRTFGYPSVHVLAFLACAALYPVCPWIFLVCMCVPPLHAFLDPSGVYVLPCPTRTRLPNCQVMYHPHYILFP